MLCRTFDSKTICEYDGKKNIYVVHLYCYEFRYLCSKKVDMFTPSYTLIKVPQAGAIAALAEVSKKLK